MNSCDFSLGQYSYAPVENDVNLENFTIEEDKDDIIPMIKDAMAVSKEGFRIFASPWTAAPWMKDNIKCLHRSMHGSALDLEYDQRDHKRSFLFSLIRDPTKRAISEFFHFRVAQAQPLRCSRRQVLDKYVSR